MGKKKTECQSTYETFQNCEKKKPQFTTYSHTAKVCYEKEDMIEGGRRSINRKKSTQNGYSREVKERDMRMTKLYTGKRTQLRRGDTQSIYKGGRARDRKAKLTDRRVCVCRVSVYMYVCVCVI